MVKEFLGIRFYKKRSVVDLHEHFLGSNDDKITHQMKFRKKSIDYISKAVYKILRMHKAYAQIGDVAQG